MRILALASLVTCVVAADCAEATNGYFAHGYGNQAKAMGGTAIGAVRDALAPASNPAAIAFLGNRIDFGLDWFRPSRGSTLDPAIFGPAGGRVHGNDVEHFFIPEFGISWRYDDHFTLGLAIYGNGGMNTDYPGLNRRTRGLGAALFGAPPTHGLLGRGRAGVDLAQLFVAPTVAVRIHPRHAVGLSVVFAAQRFKAYGLHNFANPVASVAPNSVTNRGYDYSFGYGFRIGWTGRVTETLTLGAAYQSRMWMTPFSKYNGLFAEGGDFDIPESYGIGFSWKPYERFELAGEVQVIRYDRIASVANPGNRPARLGSDNGPGFGWRDMTVFKLGLAWQASPELTLRLGGSLTNAPYRGRDTFFNILAPGTIRAHATVGFGWKLSEGVELSAYYARAFYNQVDGRLGATGISNHLAEHMGGIAVGLSF